MRMLPVLSCLVLCFGTLLVSGASPNIGNEDKNLLRNLLRLRARINDDNADVNTKPLDDKTEERYDDLTKRRHTYNLEGLGEDRIEEFNTLRAFRELLKDNRGRKNLLRHLKDDNVRGKENGTKRGRGWWFWDCSNCDLGKNA